MAPSCLVSYHHRRDPPPYDSLFGTKLRVPKETNRARRVDSYRPFYPSSTWKRKQLLLPLLPPPRRAHAASHACLRVPELRCSHNRYPEDIYTPDGNRCEKPQEGKHVPPTAFEDIWRPAAAHGHADAEKRVRAIRAPLKCVQPRRPHHEIPAVTPLKRTHTAVDKALPKRLRPDTSAESNFDYIELKHGWEHVRSLQSSTEGDVDVIRSVSGGKLFVVKHTNPTSPWDQRDRQQSLPNEALHLIHTLKGVEHNNIIRLFGAQPSDQRGRWKMYMEYCSGGDLYQQLMKFQRLDVARIYGAYPALMRMEKRPAHVSTDSLVPELFVLHVYISLTEALAYLHGGLRRYGERYQRDSKHVSVVHGDVKPANVFLRWPASGSPKYGLPEIVLADFGHTRLATHNSGASGTPAYMAPEVEMAYNGVFDVDIGVMTKAADMYSFGTLMYECATYALWKEEGGMFGQEPRLPSAYGKGVMRDLERHLGRCLLPHRNERPAAADLCQDLKTFCAERRRLYRAHGELPVGVWKSPPPV